MNKELKDKDLENITGGDVTSSNIVGTAVLHNIPKINPDEKYVMGIDPTDIHFVNTCGSTSSK